MCIWAEGCVEERERELIKERRNGNECKFVIKSKLTSGIEFIL